MRLYLSLERDFKCVSSPMMRVFEVIRFSRCGTAPSLRLGVYLSY